MTLSVQLCPGPPLIGDSLPGANSCIRGPRPPIQCVTWAALESPVFSFVLTDPEGGTMNAIPRLTIGLAVYNGENFLAQSIESLLSN
jgi:hypothetical protein